MNKDLLKGLNDHLKLEFRAFHEYLAMAIWLSEHDLPGFSTWMKQQSSDELAHAQRIIDHLVDQRALLACGQIEGPSGVGDAAMVRERADGGRGSGTCGPRAHPPGGEYRRRAADDRSGAGHRLGAGNAAVGQHRRGGLTRGSSQTPKPKAESSSLTVSVRRWNSAVDGPLSE